MLIVATHLDARDYVFCHATAFCKYLISILNYANMNMELFFPLETSMLLLNTLHKIPVLHFAEIEMPVDAIKTVGGIYRAGTTQKIIAYHQFDLTFIKKIMFHGFNINFPHEFMIVTMLYQATDLLPMAVFALRKIAMYDKYQYLYMKFAIFMLRMDAFKFMYAVCREDAIKGRVLNQVLKIQGGNADFVDFADTNAQNITQHMKIKARYRLMSALVYLDKHLRVKYYHEKKLIDLLDCVEFCYDYMYEIAPRSKIMFDFFIKSRVPTAKFFRGTVFSCWMRQDDEMTSYLKKNYVMAPYIKFNVLMTVSRGLVKVLEFALRHHTTINLDDDYLGHHLYYWACFSCEKGMFDLLNAYKAQIEGINDTTTPLYDVCLQKFSPFEKKIFSSQCENRIEKFEKTALNLLRLGADPWALGDKIFFAAARNTHILLKPLLALSLGFRVDTRDAESDEKFYEILIRGPSYYEVLNVVFHANCHARGLRLNFRQNIRQPIRISHVDLQLVFKKWLHQAELENWGLEQFTRLISRLTYFQELGIDLAAVAETAHQRVKTLQNAQKIENFDISKMLHKTNIILSKIQE